jgi:Kef-type K+ transport system membrane component KefB
MSLDNSEFYMLFIVGLIIVVGFAAGKLFQRLKIPRVAAFIVIGLIFGSTGVISSSMLEGLRPIIDLAFGFIGFTVGVEVNFQEIPTGSKRFFLILTCQAIAAFAFVAALFYIVSGQFYLALIFGALATTTSPAATIEVIREYCAKGELTQMVVFIVALGDIIAVLVFNFVLIYAAPQFAWDLITVLTPLIETAFALLLGGLLGYVIVKVEVLFKDDVEWIVITIGAVLLCTGISQIFGFSSILSNMALGIAMENCAPAELKIFEEKLDFIIFPLFISFFVLTGAHLNLAIIVAVGFLTGLYIIARTGGKILGAYGGAKLVRKPPQINNYLGIAILSQAGVALGLAYLASSHLTMLGNADGGLLIFNVITAAVVIMEFVGPLGVKFSLQSAKECQFEP